MIHCPHFSDRCKGNVCVWVAGGVCVWVRERKNIVQYFFLVKKREFKPCLNDVFFEAVQSIFQHASFLILFLAASASILT